MKKINIFFVILVLIIITSVGVSLYLLYKKTKDVFEPNNNDNISQNINKSIEGDNTVIEGFDDGLSNPDFSKDYELDEFGAGISKSEVFFIDINSDGLPDKIIKSLIETGNSHNFTEYKIEISKDGSYIDLTLDNFRTIQGADCDLQRFKFSFNPFRITKISRSFKDTWNTETMATKIVYIIQNNELVEYSKNDLKYICDVGELF